MEAVRAIDPSTTARILVVDDEPYVRTTVREVMNDEGYEVFDASTGEECFSLLSSQRIDVILLDIKLPGMDGMEAFRRICKQQYHVDVIMISGHGNIETAVEAIKQGAYDYLEKPFTMAKLKNVVKSVLERQRQARLLDEANEKNRIIGKYHIVGKIASGGTATVYRAVQIELERSVALKVLHTHLTENDEFHERFFREAKIMGTLSHPAIVQVFDYGQVGHNHYLAMEYVEGVSLDRCLSSKKTLPRAIGLHIMIDICRALEHAHKRDVVHRDLKPQNILVSRDAAVKLADFGMARMLDGSMRQLTAPNHVAGTPQFLSPEQIRGQEAGPASDIFSLGTILYLVATGQLPFSGGNIAEVLHRINTCVYDPPEKHARDLAPQLAAAITTCLQSDPSKRFRSVTELRKKLIACLDDKDKTNREKIMADYFSAHK
ncbi:MAG: protein kinase [Chitinispirillaceae bacterium]|nr:protein kinase [Chitinispirillaceae bacterium]